MVLSTTFSQVTVNNVYLFLYCTLMLIGSHSIINIILKLTMLFISGVGNGSNQTTEQIKNTVGLFQTKLWSTD
jgi:hypothetical protein